MKLGIVHTWEDEGHYQSGTIELNDAQLQSIYGGGGYGGGGPVPGAPGLGGGGPFGGPFLGGGVGAGFAHAGAFADSERIHSFSVICDVNVFSNNIISGVLSLINIANQNTQVCVNNN